MLRLVNYGTMITAKRLKNLDGDLSSGIVNPLFLVFAMSEDVHERVMSFLDPDWCCVRDRKNLLTCWKAMGGDEMELRNGREDDVSSWYGITVEEGRVTMLNWEECDLHGTIPAEIGSLTALTDLRLQYNRLNGELPSELGNLTSLAILYLRDNIFCGAIPQSLANLTTLRSLSLHHNQGQVQLVKKRRAEDAHLRS